MFVSSQWRSIQYLMRREGPLLLVRPHAVREGKLGLIVHQLLGSGFAIAGLYMLQLTRPNAGEFFEVYKGVVPEYAEWVEESTSAMPCPARGCRPP